MLSNCSEIEFNSKMKKIYIFYIKFIGFYIPYIIREHFFLKEGPWEWVWVRYIFYGRGNHRGNLRKRLVVVHWIAHVNARLDLVNLDLVKYSI